MSEYIYRRYLIDGVYDLDLNPRRTKDGSSVFLYDLVSNHLPSLKEIDYSRYDCTFKFDSLLTPSEEFILSSLVNLFRGYSFCTIAETRVFNDELEKFDEGLKEVLYKFMINIETALTLFRIKL